MAGKTISVSDASPPLSDREDSDEDTGIDLGLLLKKMNIGPKKKLLVLSLNGLLVHRDFCRDFARIPKNRTFDGRYGNHLVYKRPFSDDFVRFCFERFEVGIWSSAIERNVGAVLDIVLGGLRQRLQFVFDQEECTNSGFKALEKKEKPLFLKELRTVWLKGFKYSASDTLLIDDKPYKALLNPPNTGIFPWPYDPNNVDDNALDPKGELCQYLDGLADAENVPSYVKENPFGQQAVSPAHPDWEYYSKVLRSLHRD
ncbi:NIF domain-containing protein [Cephalotus follicularis]|uniref:Mitochondrial import inner membrane translocase subunit TIM50 n=1 Tax=Cephalotus follicularis TaxID=3775 RepID=A0A1Q3C1A0_CEPFO|nr:NIF domain-containing protein [Cephalotus follicularis]